MSLTLTKLDVCKSCILLFYRLKMVLVSALLRLSQLLLSVPLKAIHWASFKVPVGVKEWNPLELISTGSKYALLILNQPIAFTKDSAVMIWNRGT